MTSSHFDDHTEQDYVEPKRFQSKRTCDWIPLLMIQYHMFSKLWQPSLYSPYALAKRGLPVFVMVTVKLTLLVSLAELA